MCLNSKAGSIFTIFHCYSIENKNTVVLIHSSLLSVFGLNAVSTYDSYLPLIFGKFALI